MGAVGRRNYKGQPSASPLRRIMTARGLNMMETAVHSNVSLPTIRKLVRMDPKVIGGIKVESLLRIAQWLEVAPTDLMPFLAATGKRPGGSV